MTTLILINGSFGNTDDLNFVGINKNKFHFTGNERHR
jgi:hypothetical protein